MAKGSRSKELVPRREVEYDGEVYNLAVVTKGRHVSDEDKIEIAELVCAMYQTDKHTIADCLNHVGISEASWFVWRSKVKEIKELYIKAQSLKDSIYRQRLKHRARTMAEKMIDGFTVETLEHEGEEGHDDEGNPIMITSKIRRKQTYVRPSPTLIQFALTNMDGGNFERNPVPKDGTTEGVNIPPIDWVE